jgi:hypothetical protein
MDPKQQNDLLEEMLSGPQFALTHAEKRERLLPLLAAHSRLAAAGNAALARYNSCLDLPADPRDYSDLPYLSVSAFKEYDLATVPSEEVMRTLTSSATTGANPSRVPLDKGTGKRQARGLAAILKDIVGKQRRPFLVLDVPDINQPGAQLSARGAAVRGIMPFASEVVYALRLEEGRFVLDREAVEQFFLKHFGQEVLLFGFTYLVWTEVVAQLRQAGEKFAHPQMTLLHSGGWKKLTEQQVDKQTFAAGVGEVFGCPPEQVRDFYGMVEQVGVVFVDCEAGHKHSPAFAEVAIRDFHTLEQVPVGGQGLIQVMSALPSSYPGYALITEDVGTLLGYDDCPCGRKGLYFRFRSRVHQVEVRGCGDTMAQARVLESVPESTPAKRVAASDELQHLAGVAPITGAGDETMGDLQARLLDTPPIPLGAVTALLDDGANKLLDPQLAGVEGLAFLSAWLKGSNLRRVLQTNFAERLAALNSPQPDAAAALLAVPRGLAGHWVAGNVPTLAVFSWALATLAGNASVVRVSRAAVDQARALFLAIEKAEAEFEGRKFSGADLLARTSVVHFDSAHEGWNQALSRVADVRLIWGSGDAVNAVRRLPVPDHGEDLVFGPKFSLAVVDRARLADPEGAEEVARLMAREVATFDQAACSSPQVLYLEGFAAEHAAWLGQLHAAMAAVEKRAPRGALAESAAARIIRQRASHGLAEGGGVWASRGTQHTILLDGVLHEAGPHHEAGPLPEAVHGRCLFVCCVPDLAAAMAQLSPKIQTLGLAVGDDDLRRELSLAAARAGVSRCVPLGTMNFFETPWDGMLPLQRLVRWVRLPDEGEGRR